MTAGKRFLECCCSDAREAAEAQCGGAQRIELCENLSCGGVTPSEENIRATLSAVRLPVNVLIRPRGGSFVYDEEEVKSMLSSIRLCKTLGVNGIVAGALKEDGSIDVQTVRRLIEEAGGLHVTFHRAFDECSEPFNALEDIIGLGCDRLLTAGHSANVTEGIRTLKALDEKAAGRIIILAGSGVRPSNIAEIEAFTNVKEFHSSSRGPDGRLSRDIVSRMVNVNV